MALLYRMVRINDKGGTRVFSFVVTKTVTRDLHRDLTTKEFPYGFHKWAVAFSRTEKQLGVYLVWKTACERVSVLVDFAFSLLNREHFSGNESFSGKQIKFSKSSPAQGNRKFITILNLCEHKFTDVNGEFQLELTMTNLRTSVDITSSPANPTVSSPSSTGETSNLTYGGFEWNLSVEKHDGQVMLFPRRLSGLEHLCRLRFCPELMPSTSAYESAAHHSPSSYYDVVSDHQGLCDPWTTRSPAGADDRHTPMCCHLSAATAISELLVTVTDEHQQEQQSPQQHETPEQLVMCRDHDQQNWAVQADTHGHMLRIRLVFKDIHNIPRNHLRFISCNIYLVRRHPKGGFLSPSLVSGGPFGGYYVHDDYDEGVLVETDVSVQDLRSAGSLYLNERRQLVVHVEWLETVLLFQATYHRYDDISRAHNFQMRREISALQTENYSLERQLFSYQKSIAFASSRGTYSDEIGSPSGGGVNGGGPTTSAVAAVGATAATGESSFGRGVVSAAELSAGARQRSRHHAAPSSATVASSIPPTANTASAIDDDDDDNNDGYNA